MGMGMDNSFPPQRQREGASASAPAPPRATAPPPGLTLQTVWVQMDLMGWALMWSVFGWVEMGYISLWGGVEQVLCKYRLNLVGLG